MFFAFTIGSIYGCAEKPKPITFAGPGVQIWKLNIVYDNGMVLKDQTLLLKPSETEKGVVETHRKYRATLKGKSGEYVLYEIEI